MVEKTMASLISAIMLMTRSKSEGGYLSCRMLARAAKLKIDTKVAIMPITSIVIF